MQDNQLLVKTVMLQMVEEDQYAEDQSGLLVFTALSVQQGYIMPCKH